MKRALRVTIVLLVVLLVAGGIVFWQYPLWVNDQTIRLHLWRSGVKSDYVQVDGYRLHYFEARPRDGSAGTPLLLVHGLGARVEDWGNLIPGLAAQGFHVYAPDLLGFGRSPQPDVNYSISLEEQIVVDFMRAMGLSKADVGGWSMGGWISMKMALDHPAMVERLVVYDSAGLYFDAAGDADVFTPSGVEGVHRLFKILSPRVAQLPDFVARAVVRRNGAMAWVIHRSVTAMMGGRDLLDFRLGQMQRPTLVVWGARDDLIPLETGERMHKLIPGSSMAVIEGCGHLAPAECWQPTLEATVGFLRAQPVPAGGRTVYAAPVVK